VSKLRVAVLGAGPMGLAAAYQAALDGRDVVVFEAADRIGGMAASFDFGGMKIERYYHFHCITDRAFLELLRELGIESSLHWANTRMGYFYKGELFDWGSFFALLKFPDLNLIQKLRYGLHAFVTSKSNHWQELDRIPAKQWIRSWVGENAYDVLWTKLFELKFHRYADQISAAWIWSRVRRLARSRDKYMRELLGYLDGGSETLLDAMRDAIVERGGDIRLSTAATRVVVENGALKGVEAGARLERFDAVISTVPLPYVVAILKDALPEEILERYRTVQYMGVVCVIAKLAKRLSDKFWINVHDPEMDIPGLVEYTNLRPMEHNIVFVPYYLPGDHPKYREPDDVFRAKVRSYLQRVNRSLRDEDILDIRVHRYRYAQPICPVGFGQHLPDWKLPIKNLFVADTSFYYPEDRGISESIELARKMASAVQELAEFVTPTDRAYAKHDHA
jgi:protoporphyrinogen oxidase